jgi:hypothetical protein
MANDSHGISVVGKKDPPSISSKCLVKRGGERVQATPWAVRVVYGVANHSRPTKMGGGRGVVCHS